MSLLIVTSGEFALHQTPPGHAECPERGDTMQAVADLWRERGAVVVEPAPATAGQLGRVHTAEHLAAMAATAGRAVMLDPDTFTSPRTWEIARLAAGAAVAGVDAVLDGRATTAAALVRPPGHHAEPARAMGFCLLNNVAVAAAHALERGVPRVAIVDFDVHHGNGTQEAFKADPRVLFVSTHQWPYYPGSGAADDAGVGDGEGFTVNVPIEAGATDADYDEVFRGLLMPLVAQFDPGIVLVSAGYDAHDLDPLGGMCMTAAGYANLMRQLTAAAAQCAGRRVVMVTEGGYHLPSLAASLNASLAVMAGEPAAGREDRPPAAGGSRERGVAAAARARRIQSRYWRGL